MLFINNLILNSAFSERSYFNDIVFFSRKYFLDLIYICENDCTLLFVCKTRNFTEITKSYVLPITCVYASTAQACYITRENIPCPIC